MRVAGNDYSVDPSAIGQLVEVTTTLAQVTVTRSGRLLAVHDRCWAARQTLTDPERWCSHERSRLAKPPERRLPPDLQGCAESTPSRAAGMGHKWVWRSGLPK